MAGQHDFGLAILPNDILMLVMADFLGGSSRDMSAMDVAFAPSVREDFLAVVSNPGFHVHGLKPIGRMLEYLAWVRARHGQLSAVDLTWSQLLTLTAADGPTLSAVRDIVLRKDQWDFYRCHLGNVFERLFINCPRLEAIEIQVTPRYSGENRSRVTNALVAHCPTLNLRKFVYSEKLESPHERTVLLQIARKFCATLEVIEINDQTVVLNPETVLALQACTKLTSITLSVQAASIDSLRFVAGMPNLRHLTLEHLFCEDLVTEDALSAVAPCFAQLESLVFCCFSLTDALCTTKLFNIFIKACPNIEKLQIAGMTYRIVSNDVMDGCVLTVYCPAIECNTVHLLLAACPVPVLGFGCEGYLQLDNIELVASEVIGRPLNNCELLRLVDGANPMAYNIRDGHLRALAGHCSALHHFSINDAGGVTDEGICGLLQSCGASLITLELVHCQKLTTSTLAAIVEHCPDLEKLTIVKTAITIADLLSSLILPDYLKQLCKLVVGTKTCTILRNKGDVAVRWRNIVQNQ